MLGNVLIEIIAGLVPGPSTDRGLLRLFVVLGALAASTQLVLRITVGDLMTAPEWAWSLFLGALILGITGTVFGVLAALRSAQHRLLAFVCLAINLAANLAAFAVAAYR